MKEQIIFILCGEAFSGKSTTAKELASKYGAKIVGIDEVYFAAENILALEILQMKTTLLFGKISGR